MYKICLVLAFTTLNVSFFSYCKRFSTNSDVGKMDFVVAAAFFPHLFLCRFSEKYKLHILRISNGFLLKNFLETIEIKLLSNFDGTTETTKQQKEAREVKEEENVHENLSNLIWWIRGKSNIFRVCFLAARSSCSRIIILRRNFSSLHQCWYIFPQDSNRAMVAC